MIAGLAGEFLKLRGARYRCRKRFVSVSGLDPLATFFFEKVLKKERRIEALVHSFGLPRRVIEDVLGELLRSNHALLDLVSGEIRDLQNARERREHRLGDDLDVWQDELTGAYLPYDKVETYTNRPADYRRREVPVTRRQQDFLETPDARIIEALRHVHPAIMESGPPGFVLDSLPEKQRIEPCEVYLPIRTTTIDDRTVSFVHEHALPYWLCREWSVALRKNMSAASDDEDAVIVRALRTRENPADREKDYVVEGCRFEAPLNQWMKAIHQFADPAEEIALDRLNDLRATLVERLRSRESVTFLRPASGESHLRELWGRATSYLLVVSRTLTTDRIREIVAETIANTPKPVHLILLNAGPGRSSFVPGEGLSAEVIVHDTPHRITPDMIVADGAEARIGELESLRSAEPVVCVRERTVAYFVSTLLRELKYQNAGWWIRRQLASVVAEPPSVLDEDVRAVIERLEHLGEEMTKLLDSENDDAAAGTKSDRNAVARTLWDRSSSLALEIPPLKERAGQSVLTVDGGDQVAVLVETLELASLGRVKTIDLYATSAPRAVDIAALLKPFAEALQAGTVIRLIAVSSTSWETLQVLRGLAKQLDRPSISVTSTNAKLLPAMIVDDRVVVIGGSSWFAKASDANCAFAVEAPALAAQIREVAG